MQNKIKNIVISIGFIVILMTILIANILIPDEKISISERRKLAQFPEITLKNILKGNTSKEFEKYAIDQFVGRDIFRSIKSVFNMEIYKQKDNNKLFIKDETIYKMEYPLNEVAVEKTAKKIAEIKEKYLQGMTVYYSIIPEKNYYLQDDHLKMDYKKIQEIMQRNITDMTYINIFSELTTEDYYRTDTHWKQENIRKVVEKLEKEMNLKDTSKIEYIEKELGDFYGVYYAQMGLKIKPDKIKYLTNDTIENCTTYNYETKQIGKVYDLEKYKNSPDKYNIFVSGGTPLITIDNPNATTDKKLLLFRDSFGSSLAPLLIENYKKITLIDIRYIDSSLLKLYINFNNQDVLFIYSGLVLNQNILK